MTCRPTSVVRSEMKVRQVGLIIKISNDAKSKEASLAVCLTSEVPAFSVSVRLDKILLLRTQTGL